MIYDGIDTSQKLTAEQAKALKDIGMHFVVRYLVPNEGDTAWKALTQEEADIIRSAGLYLMLCFESSATRVRGGAENGAEDGKIARALAEQMHIPLGTVIYFAADYNVPAKDYPAVDAYIRAARVALGKYSAGLYGHENICEHVSAHCTHLWQCVAWSNMFIDAAKVRQYQWQGGPEAMAIKNQIGVAVDLDAADTLDGMWPPKNVYEDGDGVIYEYSAQAKRTQNETAPALKWARECGIITEDMTDCDRIAVIFRRYHNTFIQPEDDYSIGTKG